MRNKEEIIEHYLYQLQEKFEWSLHNEDFNSYDIEEILRDMYEELKPTEEDKK